MATTRVQLIAAAALAGLSVGPLSAQPPIRNSAESFEVLAPRRLALPKLPFGGEAQEVPAGFFNPASNQQPAALGAPTRPQTPQQQPQQGVTVMPLFGKPQPPTGRQMYPALTAATPAPAWRWHGYGSVGTNSAIQPTTPQVFTGPMPNPGLSGMEFSGPITLPMPTAIVPQPMPPGPLLQGPPSRPQPALPSSGPLPAYSPPVDAVPLPGPGGDATWKPSGERFGIVPTNPMNASGVEPAAYMPPRINDGGAVRAAFVPSLPAAPPKPAAKTAEGPLVDLRSTIETICAGRGRDLDMFFRSPNHLLIRMTVRQSGDAERLANLISKLPEISAYHVVFEMSIVP